MKKILDKILYKDSHFYASFPSAVNLANNEIILMFRRARDFRWLLDDDDELTKELRELVDHIDSRSHLVTIKLDQNLNLISNEKILSIDPEAADQDASLLLLKSGSLMLSSFAWYPLPSRLAKSLRQSGVAIRGHFEDSGCYFILWGGYTRYSKDFGKNWSDHQYLPPMPQASDIIPGKRKSCGGPTRGQAVEMGNDILLPVYNYLTSHTSGSCHLYISTDQGKSWTYRSMIAFDPEQNIHFNEPSLLHCKGDKIIAFMRTFNADDHLYTATSHDRGVSWEKWQKRKEIVGHPIHPLRLKDGRVFISYGYRHEPYGIRARLMDKNANDFIGEELIIREDGASADLGYPWATQLNNGDILVVYYFTEHDGIRHISSSLISLD